MYDCIIVGMGCAGMSAGIYAKRAGLNTLMLDEIMPGENLAKISVIENYLGFKSITGSELANQMFEHIKSENVPFNIAKLKYIEAFNQEFNYGTDVEKILMLMEIANDFNLTLLMWHKENMNNFVYVNEINNENDFILAYNSLNGFKEWLQGQNFAKISEKNLNCIDQKYINIQKLNIEV